MTVIMLQAHIPQLHLINLLVAPFLFFKAAAAYIY